MSTINKQTHVCECGHKHTISEREIALYSGMVSALWRVFKWCEEKQKYEFSRKDVKHLLANENDSARFGDWVLFGGLVYKEGKGRYGLNLHRCGEFFAGRYMIPSRVWKNPVTGQITQGQDVTIDRIPNLLKFLDQNQEYVARYRESKQGALL